MLARTKDQDRLLTSPCLKRGDLRRFPLNGFGYMTSYLYIKDTCPKDTRF